MPFKYLKALVATECSDDAIPFPAPLANENHSFPLERKICILIQHFSKLFAAP